MNKFTVFTGTYNSENLIKRVFQSITEQTYRNFEWIVIDDASKDNTVELLEDFKKQNSTLDIKIITLEKNVGVGENRRKAIKLAAGDFFITWDHDDEQLPNQLEIFNSAWENYGNDNIANIFAFCQNQNGEILGNFFPKGTHIGNYFTYYRDYFMTDKVKQEKHVCSKVTLLKEYVNYIFPEGIRPNGDMFWAKLATKYNSIFINEPLRVYYIEESNKNNMSSATREQSADKIFTMKKVWINNFLNYLTHEPLLILRLLFSTSFYGLLSEKSSKEIINASPSLWKKVILLISIIPAKILIRKLKLGK